MKRLFGYVCSVMSLALVLSACGGGGGTSSSSGGGGTTSAVPNVIGITQAQAVATLTSASLVAGTVTQQNSTTVASGIVISQNPAAGISVATGSSVSLVVSSGPPSSGGTSATGNVSTNSPGVATIATGTGAKITVPEGAVPKTSSGANGTIAFSVEKDTTTTLQVPTGVTKNSDAYRFGPGGTIFNKPVAVTIPFAGPCATDREYFLYRVNQTTGKSEPYSAICDPVAKTLTAQTYEFSPWYGGDRPYVNTAQGCVNVDNSSSSIWRTVVTQQYTLKYPSTDTNFTGASATWSNGAIGWTNHSDWYLPQGTYQMCVEGEIDGAEKHSDLIPVAINSPWSRTTPICTNMGISGVLLNQSGPCGASPPPTATVGTGALQISLTWHSASAIDLDLHVEEPNGNVIYWGETQSATGGELDQDNQCFNYVNGRSENIFWAAPPGGTYKIKVKFFNNCSGGSATSLPFDLRIVNNGVTTTYSGTSSEDVFKTITVAGGSSGTFTNKLTIGSGFDGSDITGAGTSFSLAALTSGNLYAHMESASPFGTKFARLYIDLSQKDYCTTCNSQPLVNGTNLKVGSFRVTNAGTYTVKAYAVETVVDIGVETLLGQTTITVGQ